MKKILEKLKTQEYRWSYVTYNKFWPFEIGAIIFSKYVILIYCGKKKYAMLTLVPKAPFAKLQTGKTLDAAIAKWDK